jgi:hypothetical protein
MNTSDRPLESLPHVTPEAEREVRRLLAALAVRTLLSLPPPIHQMSRPIQKHSTDATPAPNQKNHPRNQRRDSGKTTAD